MALEDIPPKDMLEDICLVIDEWTVPEKTQYCDITPREAVKLKKKLKKAFKKGNLKLKIDAQMKFRLCAARLMRGQFLKPWCFEGFEYRSHWALNLFKHGSEWRPMWPGGDGDVRVLMEQGIGDEILFASTFEEFFKECPSGTVEIDNRLIPIMERSFEGRFTSRWILGDEERKPVATKNYDNLGIDFKYWVCGADLIRKYRTGKKPPGEAYLIPNPDMVEKYKELLSEYPKPWIGLSWKGGRSNMVPEDLRNQEGTYINFQYGRKEHNGNCWIINTEKAPEWVKDVPVDHNDMDQVFGLCAALDEVNTTQNYITHVCGSIGKKCNVVKPPPMFGPVGTDDSDNNRLKWNYGLGGKHPWYNSVEVYNTIDDFRG